MPSGVEFGVTGNRWDPANAFMHTQLLCPAVPLPLCPAVRCAKPTSTASIATRESIVDSRYLFPTLRVSTDRADRPKEGRDEGKDSVAGFVTCPLPGIWIWCLSTLATMLTTPLCTTAIFWSFADQALLPVQISSECACGVCYHEAATRLAVYAQSPLCGVCLRALLSGSAGGLW